MSDPNDNLGVGDGQPPLSPLGGPSLEAEEKAIRSGKGKMMTGMIIAVVAAMAGVIALVSLGSGDDTWSKFGRNINGLRTEHFDAFWGCSLRGANLSDIRNNADLTTQINTRTKNGRARYVRHVRDECLPKLTELEPKLQSLIPPEEMQTNLQELTSSVSDLRSGWSGFIAHVEGLGENSYDEDAASEHVLKISKGWYDYRRTHNEMNSVVRQQLGR